MRNVAMLILIFAVFAHIKLWITYDTEIILIALCWVLIFLPDKK